LGSRNFRRLTKILYELGNHPEILNMDIPWHNCIVLSSESPNIFCFVLFGIIRLQETFEKKIEGLKISRKSSIYIFPGTTGSFWVYSLQTFFVLSYLGLTDFRTLTKIFYELGDHQKVLNMDILWHNWIVLGSESPNIFCFVLFRIIRLQETFEKKN
jgi:uncharacterized protein Usg